MRRPTGLMIGASAILAGALIVVPLLGLAAQSWPPQFGSIQWRFGVGGLLSGTLSNSAVGLLILLWIGFLAGNRWILRSFVAISAGLVIVGAGVLGMFLLDFVQLRQLVEASAQAVFDRSGFMAVGSLSLMLGVFIALVLAGASAIRGLPRDIRDSAGRRGGAGIVAAGRAED